MTRITSSGLVLERLDEILDGLETAFKTIYGQDIDVTPESADGQWLGILAQIKADLQELLLNIYRQVDPDLATGAWLEQRVAYAGLERKQASYSYLKRVILTGTAGTHIPRGTVLADKHSHRWQLVDDVNLGELGSARGDFRSEKLGAYPLPADSHLEIMTHMLGFKQAITSTPAQVGVKQETDEQLRQRFYLSRARTASTSAEAICGRLLSLADVKQAVVLENNTNATDERGVAPHTINAIVDGGDEQEIATAIYHSKALGVGIQGEMVVCLMLDGQERSIKFDRPSKVDIHIHLELIRSRAEIEIDTEAIKQALERVSFEIGGMVELSRLYTPINSVAGFWVKSLKIGKTQAQLQAENISIAQREQARILAQNIRITVQD